MEPEARRRADAVDRYWDAVLDGSAPETPEEIGPLAASLIGTLATPKEPPAQPSEADLARVWGRIQKERTGASMSTVIAFPLTVGVGDRRATVPRSLGQLVATIATALLLIGTAALGYLSFRPEHTPQQPVVFQASPEPTPAVPQFLIDWAAARSSGDVNQLSEFYVSPDIQFHDFALGLIAMNRGQFRSHMSDLTQLAGKPTYIITGGFIDGTHAVAEWTESGTDQGIALTGQAPSGKPFTIQGVSVFELRDGKLAVQRDYYDLYSLLDQVGGFSSPSDAATPTP